MKQNILQTIIFLCCSLSSCLTAQTLPVNAISTPHKGEGYSLARMDDDHYYMFIGPGTIHFDSSGIVIWYKRYLSIDYGLGAIRANSRGGLNILSHSTGSVFGNGDLLYFDQDSDGNCNWVKIFGTAAAEIPAGFTENCIGQTILASTLADPAEDGMMMLMALDTNGDQLWQRKYSTEFGSLKATGIKDYNDKLLLCGVLNNKAGIIMLSDAYGHKEWAVGIGECPVIDLAPDPIGGRIFFCGSSMNPADSSVTDLVAGAIDSAGGLIWAKRIGYPAPGNHEDTVAARCIYYDPSAQKLLITGSIVRNFAPQRNTQALLMVLSEQGELLQQEITGGAGEDYFNSLVGGNSGSYVACGYTNSYGSYANTLLAGITGNGEPLCLSEDIHCIADSLAALLFDPVIHSDTLNVDVSTFCHPAHSDSFNIQNLCVASLPESISREENDLTIWPNPVTGQLWIEFTSDVYASRQIIICNSWGQTLYLRETRENQLVIPTDNLGSGKYYLITNSEEKRIINEFIKY